MEKRRTARRRIFYSVAARRELISAWQWIKDRSGRSRADAMLRRLKQQIELLASSPNLGRAEPEFGPDVRVLVSYPYLVFYVQDQQRIDILRIIDGRRDVSAVWQTPDDPDT